MRSLGDGILDLRQKSSLRLASRRGSSRLLLLGRLSSFAMALHRILLLWN